MHPLAFVFLIVLIVLNSLAAYGGFVNGQKFRPAFNAVAAALLMYVALSNCVG